MLAVSYKFDIISTLSRDRRMKFIFGHVCTLKDIERNTLQKYRSTKVGQFYEVGKTSKYCIHQGVTNLLMPLYTVAYEPSPNCSSF